MLKEGNEIYQYKREGNETKKFGIWLFSLLSWYVAHLILSQLIHHSCNLFPSFTKRNSIIYDMIYIHNKEVIPQKNDKDLDLPLINKVINFLVKNI